MRVGLDCRSVFPGRGGIGRYAEALARNLPGMDRGNEYLVMVTQRQQAKICKKATQLAWQCGMIDSFWEQLQLPQIIQEYELDLYHNPCFSVPIAAGRGKCIATVHDVVFRQRPELVEPALREYLDLWTEVAVTKADEIITVSHYSKEQIVKLFGVAREKVNVVYNGLGKKFAPASDKEVARVRKKYALKGRFILYLGSMEIKKNLPLLLDAYRQLHERNCSLQLVMAGSESPGNFCLRQALRERGLEQVVKILGFVPEADVVGLLSAARIFVYPSLYEGFGFPPLEAMACGTPAIVSDCTSLPEVVGDAALVVEDGDCQGLAKTIERLAEDKEYYRSMVNKGRQWSRQFTIKRCVQETLAVYQRVLDL